MYRYTAYKKPANKARSKPGTLRLEIGSVANPLARKAPAIPTKIIENFFIFISSLPVIIDNTAVKSGCVYIRATVTATGHPNTIEDSADRRKAEKTKPVTAKYGKSFLSNLTLPLIRARIKGRARTMRNKTC
jgi:hypothetical protein